MMNNSSNFNLKRQLEQSLNPISLTNADCVHHAFEEIGLIKKSFPFSEINFPKIKFFSELCKTRNCYR